VPGKRIGDSASVRTRCNKPDGRDFRGAGATASSEGFDAIAEPVPGETSHTRTLKRAMEIAGSMQGLAERLGVSVTDLSDWIAGIRRAPTDVYLRALDLVARGRVPGAGD
jgi:hypothetical protein